MTNRKIKRAAAAKDRKTPTVEPRIYGVISEGDLSALIEAKGQVDLAEAEYKAKGSAFEVLFTKAMMTAKAPKLESVFCWECGAVYLRNIRDCPKCKEAR